MSLCVQCGRPNVQDRDTYWWRCSRCGFAVLKAPQGRVITENPPVHMFYSNGNDLKAVPAMCLFIGDEEPVTEGENIAKT